ncbi:MAG: Cro/Cl family transcriptional regulator [Massilia sp.]
MDKLLTYINNLSKEDRAAFCLAVGASLNYLRKAISASELLRVPLCVRIEKHSKKAVTRKDLRPDDWADNWPELVGDDQ